KCSPTTSSGQKVRWYGITPPISEDLPLETDLIQTRKLIECLRSCDIFEDYLEQQHRYVTLESLFKEWLKEMCVEMNVPEIVKDNVGGKVLPFGSYRLGAYSKGNQQVSYADVRH
uniref:Poly(A) polymerase alpha n=1 Tax=Cynoglossus semilaevis TaxID=244447 RepID=A0A3P8UK81_CYNSE